MRARGQQSYTNAPGGDAAQPDYQYAQSGIDFLNATHDKPFFLSVGFVRPHLGWYVPQRFFDLYPKDTLVLPSAPPGDLDDLGAAGRATALKFNFHKCHWHKLALWERATRVPLLIRLPGQEARMDIDACVSLRDLAPTLLDRCGVTPAYAMDGRSLNPLLADPTLSWEHPVLTTKDEHDHAIRTPDWRYIRYASGERELYDEKADPGEVTNLAGSTQYEALMAELDALMPPKP